MIKSGRIFLCLLVAIILISLGQTLWMGVWEDDNALFFKLAHLSEPAGYLGPGIFGAGPYKYTATFYIPIHKLFGFISVYYFAYGLFFYLISTLVILKVYSYIFGQKGGRVAALLYACGFIASESFIRLFNSVSTSISIILISGLMLFYWKFYKEEKAIWYIIGFFAFAASLELVPARTHYLISIVIIFELIFLAFRKLPQSIFSSALRMLPFILLFLKMFVLDGDSRNSLVSDYLKNILQGQFYLTFDLISSFSNLITSRWFFDLLNNLQSKIILSTGIGFPYVKYLLLLVALVYTIILFKKQFVNKIPAAFYFIILILWVFFSKKIFFNPVLNLDESQLLLVTWGGILLILSSTVLFILKREKRKLYLFLLLWIIVNIGVYGIYNPTNSYSSENRYLAHSFFALVGIFGLLLTNVKKEWVLYKVVLCIIILWGVSNLVDSVLYQHSILQTRSNPSNDFYSQLKILLPTINKGDVLYFDSSDKNAAVLSSNMAVAQMPESTVFAWRYGVDRYDISVFRAFDQFIDYVKINKVPQDHIQTFWYTGGKLSLTSDRFRQLLSKGENDEFKIDKTSTKGKDLEIDLDRSIDSLLPAKVILSTLATYSKPEEVNFSSSDQEDLSRVNKIKKALNYRKIKNESFMNAYSSSSDWQTNTIQNIHDNDPSTFWQPDRVLWPKGGENFIIDLGLVQTVGSFVWVNAFPHNSPTEYSLDVSSDKSNWQTVASAKKTKRIDTGELQFISFKPRKARFIRMNLELSLNQDSPGIAESWVLPEFSESEIREAEDILKNPFNNIKSEKDYMEIIRALDFEGEAKVEWKGDKSSEWLSDSKKVVIKYDGIKHLINVVIPAGGTKITNLKLTGFQIPGTVIIDDINAKYPYLQ